LSRWPPWTLVAYVAAVVVLIVTTLPPDEHPGAVLGAFVLLGASVGLLLRLWLAWAFLIVVEIGNLIIVIVQWPSSWAVALKAVMVMLLLAGPTRRYLSWPTFARRFAPDADGAR
jgi:hypothetical protein